MTKSSTDFRVVREKMAQEWEMMAVMLKSGTLKKVEDFLKGFPVPVMSTIKVNSVMYRAPVCVLLPTTWGPQGRPYGVLKVSEFSCSAEILGAWTKFPFPSESWTKVVQCPVLMMILSKIETLYSYISWRHCASTSRLRCWRQNWQCCWRRLISYVSYLQSWKKQFK